MANDPPSPARPALTVVLPVFNEARVLDELHARVRAACDRSGLACEILVVDDGSTDGTGDRLRALAAADPALTVVELSRNFGHPAAFTAGLDLAAGESVVLMDADLQDDPGAIPELLRLREAASADVVYVVRSRRAESLPHRLLVAAFNRLLCAGAQHPLPAHVGNFSLIGPRALAALRRMPERTRYLPGLRAYAGFRQAALEVPRDRRYDARSRMGLRGLLRLAAQAFYAHTRLAQAGIALLAGTAALAAAGLVAYRIVCRWCDTAPAAGSGLAAFAAALAALVLAGQALLAGQLARVHTEVQGRPLYLVGDLRRGSAVGAAAARP